MTPDHPTPRRRGRPSSPVLSREGITAAAIRIVSTRGYDHLTMASLARELGVAASALYNHVSSKQDVLVLLQDRLNEQIDTSGFSTLPWEEALRRWALSYRDCYIRHTELIPIMAVLPVADAPQTLRMYERVTAALENAGIPGPEAVDMIVGVEALVFGAAYDASAPADIFNPGRRADLAPRFSEAAAGRGQDARAAADRAFSLTLDALIDGLRRHVAAQPAAD
ncbi:MULTISPECIES: TetR/AcrR family transcriptional regulator [Nesterenkonia]|uniref:AcrR family transcriptional regulator n=1 Tax=Nesterenkonia xinjiangensis TaxID=225327 RepID=A0A7Z0GJI9_9MICC|nr:MULTISPECIES: TetR/AcrR family transcriptional regulator [Nesterenkonia]MDZ5076853.1 TetR/AcrR family transcriptional regulator [Nesterenkonia sp. HG001]NYJ77145.1 AcrR family transcriptional regulator [Nesterenkonia xinjiangensis]